MAEDVLYGIQYIRGNSKVTVLALVSYSEVEYDDAQDMVYSILELYRLQ